MRVLVVSDDPKERMRASTALRLHGGAEVVEVDSAPVVARLLDEDDAFNVLVIDGDLDPKGGFSLLYELRAQGEYHGRTTPPALVMISRVEDRWLAGWAGFNEEIMKPVDSFRLAKAVQALVGVPAAPRDPADESGEEIAAVLESEGSAGLVPQPGDEA